jgi:hypothetical protein
MHLQFTLLRMMLAFTVFAFIFGLSSPLFKHDSEFIYLSVIVSGSISCIALIANKKDVFESIIPIGCFIVGIFSWEGLSLFWIPQLNPLIGFILGLTICLLLAQWARRMGRKFVGRET